jgi:hypothetical protein
MKVARIDKDSQAVERQNFGFAEFPRVSPERHNSCQVQGSIQTSKAGSVGDFVASRILSKARRSSTPRAAHTCLFLFGSSPLHVPRTLGHLIGWVQFSILESGWPNFADIQSAFSRRPKVAPAATANTHNIASGCCLRIK